MDHSVRGYLNRRTNEELRFALEYCLAQKDKVYQDYVAIIFEILENRLLKSDDSNKTAGQ